MRVSGKSAPSTVTTPRVVMDTTTTTVGKRNGRTVVSSWMPSLLFWSVCLVVQYYLLAMYHAVFLEYQETNNGVRSIHNNNNNNNNNNNIRQNTIMGSRAHSDPERPQTKTTKTTTTTTTTTTSSKGNHETLDLDENADGTFNGYPIYKLGKQHPLQEEASSFTTNKQQQQQQQQRNPHPTESSIDELYSQFQCVGETWHDAEFHRRSQTFHEQSWMFRSCRFQVFCYDTSTQDYVIYLDPERHQESHTDHHYHHATNSTNNTEPHPSPRIRGILRNQQQKIAEELKEIADAEHERNTTTDFKHPTFIDDTSTVFRNHTIVVNSKGEVKIGDTENGKHYGVSIGSINGKWGLVDIQFLKWFPEVRWGPIPGSSSSNNTTTTTTTTTGDSNYDVYMLPSSVAMIPFHSLAAKNPGHLVWDDFLPMYTLLDMFGFLKKKDASGRGGYTETNHQPETLDWTDLLPIRYQLPGLKKGLWASCDWTTEIKKECQSMLSKFGILMGTRRSYKKFHPEAPESNLWTENPNGIQTPPSAAKQAKIPITTNTNVELALEKSKTNDDPKTPKLICAKNGMAGYGAISDHFPAQGHGWQRWDYFKSYNAGRGGQLWEFRNFMIHNLFASLPRAKQDDAPLEKPPTAKNETTARRRLALNVETIKNQKTKSSVLLGKDQITTYPPSSITDAGPDDPLVVLYSAYSSQRRGGSMESEALLLRRVIEESGGSYSFLYGRQPTEGTIGSNVEIVVETHTFAKYTIEEQIQMASRAAAFCTFCGGGAITGSFLPKGGALHLYYGEQSGIENNKPTRLPARLDWDFFNHCGYLHVKWLPFIQSVLENSKIESNGGYTTQEMANFIDSLRENPKPNSVAGGYQTQPLANIALLRADLLRIHKERVEHFRNQQSS